VSFASRLHRLACLFVLLVATASVAASLERPADGGEARGIDPAGISGSLVICGGGKLPAPLYAEFLALAGGDEARLVVIPTGSRKRDKLDPEKVWERWRARGAKFVTVLHTRSRKEADRESFVEPLKRATGVWLSGGAQSRIADAYVGTAIEREIYALLARGGVIGGTSAGAAVQSRTMIARGNPDVEVEVGFDLLPDSVVDQHFLTRNRKPRLMRVLREHPGLVGFGIDERTGLVVAGRQLRVLGESTVTVLLAASRAQPARDIELKSGSVADLTELRQAARQRADLAEEYEAGENVTYSYARLEPVVILQPGGSPGGTELR
jgi:cyanophycinase